MSRNPLLIIRVVAAWLSAAALQLELHKLGKQLIIIFISAKLALK